MRPRRASPDSGALSRRSLPKDLPSHRLLHIEHRAIPANTLQYSLSVNFDRTHANVAGPKSANHDLFHGDLPRNTVLLSKPLHQLQQTVGATGEEGVCFGLVDQVLEDFLDVLDRATVVGIDNSDGLCAKSLEERLRHHDARTARTQDRGNPHSVIGRELRQRRQRLQADPTAEHDDILPAGLELETNAQRASDIEVVARRQHRHAAGSATHYLIEELDMASRLVNAVDAHRPAHPNFGAIGRGAEKMEHLPGVGPQRLLMHSKGQVLIFLVDPIVGYDGPDKFTDQSLRIGVRVTDPKG